MRTTFFVLLLIGVICCCNAQSHYKYQTFIGEAKAIFKEPTFRGYRFTQFIDIDSLDEVSISQSNSFRKSVSSLDENLLAAINRSRSDFESGSYFFDIYWDLYSEIVYPVISKIDRDKTIFDGYVNYYASPDRGFRNFTKMVTRGIRNNVEKTAETSFKMNNRQPVEILIDTDGQAIFLGKNSFEVYLDSAKKIKWTPSLYYGKFIKSIVRFQLDVNHILDNKSESFDLEGGREIFVLNQKFKNFYVRFEENIQQPPHGSCTVSYVLNPTAKKIENPIFHSGDLELGKELMLWLQTYDFGEIEFFVDKYNKAKRVYFYL